MWSLIDLDNTPSQISLRFVHLCLGQSTQRLHFQHMAVLMMTQFRVRFFVATLVSSLLSGTISSGES